MHWLFIPAAGSPPIRYKYVFLWIGIKLCLVKVMDKTEPTYSSQYLTLRQTRCLKVVTHLKRFFLKFERYSCVKTKNKTPQIKVETIQFVILKNIQSNNEQFRLYSAFFVTCIHFGQTIAGNVLYQCLFSKHCAFNKSVFSSCQISKIQCVIRITLSHTFTV